MKIRFLGTAAAEGVPALFCDCEVCRSARASGGKNIRMRCQSIIDDILPIDFGPDALYNGIRFGIDYTRITDIIITHVHGDHFDEAELSYRGRGFVPAIKNEQLRVWGSEEMCRLCETHLAVPVAQGRIRPMPMMPFRSYDVGGYTVTPLKADHGTEQPFIYIIERGGKTLLYAHDTGLPKDETMSYLLSCGKRFDLVSFDCTNGEDEAMTYHMGIPAAVILRERLAAAGAVTDSTVCVLNHFSHNHNVEHGHLCRVAEEMGFIVAYDGMTAEV